jgi:hypothetical protein
MSQSDYGVGAPPPRRSRRPETNGPRRPSPLIAATRTGATDPAQDPTAEIVDVSTDTVAPDSAVDLAAANIDRARLTTPASTTADAPTWKKTIAFPQDLWRYASIVYNATGDREGELYFQEFVWHAIEREAARREAVYNNGETFEGSSRIRRGRRFGAQ